MNEFRYFKTMLSKYSSWEAEAKCQLIQGMSVQGAVRAMVSSKKVSIKYVRKLSHT